MLEFDTISNVFTPLSKSLPGALDLKDDAAVIDLGGEMMLVVTSDASVEGVHFPKDAPAEVIAQRALRVNLSDLASMGAKPIGYTHSLILPKSISEDWIQGYARGLEKDQKEYGISLLGGDTVSSPGPLSVSVTAFGHVKKGADTKRSDANNGDRIFVTGPIGDAYMGLLITNGRFADLDQKTKDYFLNRYLLPTPRLKESKYLGRYFNAAIDISDGLVADILHMASLSTLKAFINIEKVPLSQQMRSVLKAMPLKERQNFTHELLSAGDDYELAVSIPADRCSDAVFTAQTHGLNLHNIGHMGFQVTEADKEAPIKIISKEGEEIKFKRVGYEHSW